MDFRKRALDAAEKRSAEILRYNRDRLTESMYGMFGSGIEFCVYKEDNEHYAVIEGIPEIKLFSASRSDAEVVKMRALHPSGNISTLHSDLDVWAEIGNILNRIENENS